MEFVEKELFHYLNNVIYNPTNAFLDIEKLPENFREFGKGLKFFSESVMEINKLIKSLSRGILTDQLPSQNNELAAPLKSLQASLKHLTWQTKQIADGDYHQRVDFMGDFSESFNTMVEQLEERQHKLKDKIVKIKKKTHALEQSNLLLTALMHYIPQQIIVIDRDTGKTLLLNDIAVNEVNNDANFIKNLMIILSDYKDLESGSEIAVTYAQGIHARYLIIRIYYLEWNKSNAQVLAISDVSATKTKIEELEMQAYRDSITHLYNRTFGMLTLDSWLLEKKRFALIFADLDSLKNINDKFGHIEGDIYIMNAAKHLKTFSRNAVVCRIGGDEFMLLAPDTDYNEAMSTMGKIFRNFENDEYLNDKTFSYSISFGVIAVGTDNKLSASDILSIADERMYENKRMKKKYYSV